MKSESGKSPSKGFFKKRKKLKIAFLVFLLLLIIGGFIANSFVKKKGYKNIWEFIGVVGSNYNKSFSANYQTIEITIDKNDYEKLKSIREKALKRGVLINEGGSFVDAVILHKGKKIKSKIRLKGHMTDHLQGKKWSFRVVTKKGDAFMGMKRFSLQHPGTRNYVYEWIYHQMMKEEGIIALQYDFIKVKLNGDDLGIYAVEEHFAQELIQRNERVKGPIIRFNPELYWSYRINELDNVKILQEYSKMQSAFIEPYDEENVYNDSSLLNSYAEALVLMEGFRRGKTKASEIFDLEKMAKFHAIIDVVGGQFSLDWSDVKYYYNKDTRRLEPVAYESFSVRNTYQLAGSYRCNGIQQNYITDLHNALFNDTVFFKHYVSALERIATKKWLSSLLQKIDKQLQNKLAILYKEFPYKDYKDKPFYDNVKNIEKLLEPNRTLHAFIEKVNSDSIWLSVAGIDALPSVIKSISVNDTVITPSLFTFVPCKGEEDYVNYQTYKFPINKKIIPTADSKWKINCAVYGSNSNRNVSIIPVPAYNERALNDILVSQKPNCFNFDFINVNESTKEIRFKPSLISVSSDLVLPAGYKIIISEGTQIDLIKGARLISYSPVFVVGSKDSPVQLISSDESGNGFTILKTSTPSQFTHFVVSGQSITSQEKISPALNLIEADAKLNHVVLAKNAKALRVVRSEIKLIQVEMIGSEKTCFEMDYAKAQLTSVKINNCNDDGIVAAGSMIRLNDVEFKKVKKSAIIVKQKTTLNGNQVKISNSKIGMESRDGSKLILKDAEVNQCELGLKASKKGDVFGPATIEIKSLKEKGNKVLKEAEKKSTIRIG